MAGPAVMPISRHILLVDDDPLFLASMTQALRQNRYRVTTAEHFAAALDLLESADEPSILVADLVIPRSINGVLLARMARLRQPSIATIFVTGYRMPDMEQMALGPVLQKPVEPAELIATIEAECARRARESKPLASSSS